MPPTTPKPSAKRQRRLLKQRQRPTQKQKQTTNRKPSASQNDKPKPHDDWQKKIAAMKMTKMMPHGEDDSEKQKSTRI
jgi:hypothetical protein